MKLSHCAIALIHIGLVADSALGAKVCSDPVPLKRFGVGASGAVEPLPADPPRDAAAAVSFVQVNDLAEASGSQSCEWVVHYDAWERSFDSGEYEHASHGGVHCLEACCRDPSCHGLELMSSELYQCYKFSHLPAALKSRSGGRMLGDGRWITAKVPRWSAFLKVGAPGVVRPSAVSLLQGGAEEPPAEDDGAKYEALANHLKGSPKLAKCGWTVFYDMWVPSFEHGEYEPSDGALGGVHCLEACCQDPQCQGLALESIEKYQCYRYLEVPKKKMARLSPNGGRPLGDSKWLTQKKAAWSVFVKEPLAPASLAQTQSFPLPQRQRPRRPAPAPLPALGGIAGEAPAGDGHDGLRAGRARFPAEALLMMATLVAFGVVVFAQCSMETPGRRAVLKVLRLGPDAATKDEGLELIPKK